MRERSDIGGTANDNDASTIHHRDGTDTAGTAATGATPATTATPTG